MARAGFILTKGTATQSGTDVAQPIFTSAGNDGGTALAAAVAVLVADGATPTQAHVTTANAALPTVQGDLQVSYDTAKITTVNQLKAAFAQLLQAARGSGIAEG
jgi:hypothetical protein